MFIPSQYVKNFCYNVAKQNLKISIKFDSLSDEQHKFITMIRNGEALFAKVQQVYSSVDFSDNLIELPNDWKSFIENNFLIKKIRSLINSSLEKQKMLQKETPIVE